MRLTAKAEYGCIAIIALALQRSETGLVRVREIAEAYRIPERYLVQILLQLKAAGLVHSARGSSGGISTRTRSRTDLARGSPASDRRARRSPARGRRSGGGGARLGVGATPGHRVRFPRWRLDRPTRRSKVARRLGDLTTCEADSRATPSWPGRVSGGTERRRSCDSGSDSRVFRQRIPTYRRMATRSTRVVGRRRGRVIGA